MQSIQEYFQARRFTWTLRGKILVPAGFQKPMGNYCRLRMPKVRLPSGMEFKELFENFSQPGKVVWIGVRPDRRVSLTELHEVMAVEDRGLAGDRHQKKGSARQVTLIQREHLDSIGSFLGKSEIDPQLTRRNLVVAGINLQSLKGKRFQVGEAVFEHTGDCHPCSRMEENLGKGGYNAMRGLGGITAKIIKSGKIRLNDALEPLKSA